MPKLHEEFYFFCFKYLAEDAVEALKYGVDGILVSNHGARQLDCVPATVSMFKISLKLDTDNLQ